MISPPRIASQDPALDLPRQCVRVVRSNTPRDRFVLHCLTHDAYGPVRDVRIDAALDWCPVMLGQIQAAHAVLAGLHAPESAATIVTVLGACDSETAREKTAQIRGTV